jgi:hypothetical protein
LVRNQQVGGSSPLAGSSHIPQEISRLVMIPNALKLAHFGTASYGSRHLPGTIEHSRSLGEVLEGLHIAQTSNPQ